MVIVAHPDDADFGPAGDHRALGPRRARVAHLVCCTSGDAGADDAADRPARAGPDPRDRSSAPRPPMSGYEEVTFLHRPDGALANDLALREQLVRLIRTFRPDAVADVRPHGRSSTPTATSSTRTTARPPWPRVDAVYPAARNAMAFPHLVIHEGLEPHAVRRLYLFWTDRPDAWVDISDTLDVKLAALREHASQLREPEELRRAHPELGRRGAATVRRRRGRDPSGCGARPDARSAALRPAAGMPAGEAGRAPRPSGPRARPGRATAVPAMRLT